MAASGDYMTVVEAVINMEVAATSAWSCLSCMFICIMLDTGFCGWFYFLSFFLLYTLASML